MLLNNRTMLEKSSLNAMHVLNLLPCQQTRQERAYNDIWNTK